MVEAFIRLSKNPDLALCPEGFGDRLALVQKSRVIVLLYKDIGLRYRRKCT